MLSSALLASGRPRELYGRNRRRQSIDQRLIEKGLRSATKENGFEVCRELRQGGVDTAILMLTAKTLVGDRVTGLRLGADDYLAKQFDPSELLARIEALIRRIKKRNRTPAKYFSFDDVEIDLAQFGR